MSTHSVWWFPPETPVPWKTLRKLPVVLMLLMTNLVTTKKPIDGFHLFLQIKSCHPNTRQNGIEIWRLSLSVILHFVCVEIASWFSLFGSIRRCKKIQTEERIKAFAAKANTLSWSPVAHMVEGEKEPPHVLFWPAHMLHHTHTHTQ